jgi:hypothetical protein
MLAKVGQTGHVILSKEEIVSVMSQGGDNEVSKTKEQRRSEYQPAIQNVHKTRSKSPRPITDRVGKVANGYI